MKKISIALAATVILLAIGAAAVFAASFIGNDEVSPNNGYPHYYQGEVCNYIDQNSDKICDNCRVYQTEEDFNSSSLESSNTSVDSIDSQADSGVVKAHCGYNGYRCYRGYEDSSSWGGYSGCGHHGNRCRY